MSESGSLSENGRSGESIKPPEIGQGGAVQSVHPYAKKPRAGSRSPGKWLFLCSFIFSCFLFWWMRSIILQLLLGLQDSVDDSTIQISVIAVICFTARLPLSENRLRHAAFAGHDAGRVRRFRLSSQRRALCSRVLACDLSS